jgi:hypothetical protein
MHLSTIEQVFAPPTQSFSEQIAALEAEVVAAVGRLDPDLVALSSVVDLFGRFDRIVRAASAARTLLARKVEESREWQRKGYSDPADWVAAATGSSRGAAQADLKTSRALKDLPNTSNAMRSGDVSPAQGAAIADAARINPKAEQDLLAQASTKNLNELRQAAGRAKAAGDPDPDATHARIHKERRLSRFSDGEGAFNMAARGTADGGAVINSALDPIIDELYRANRNGQRWSRDTYAFDALVELCRRAGQASKPGKNPNPRYLALLRLDVEALHRGRVEGDELCEITGVGPIPVEVAKGLLGEAILKLVITNGVDVLNVTSLGRGPTAAMKVALAWSQPTCTAEGCSRTHIEYDHKYAAEYAKTKHTRLDETDPLCTHEHDLKTRLGWALVEGKGKRPFVPPDDPRHPMHAGSDPPSAPPDVRPATKPLRSLEEIRAIRSAIARRCSERLEADIAAAARAARTGQPGQASTG